jgi:hypothetical protein
VNDYPAVLGVFPPDKRGAADYFFGPANYGGRNFKIIVDGKATPIGPQFVSGPVVITGMPLADGSDAHLIQLGAFLLPLQVGKHTVRIQGEIGNSQLYIDAYGSNCMQEEFTYTVKVLPVLGN